MPKTSITPTKKPSTPTKTPSTPNKTQSTPTKRPSTPTKTPSTPTKTQVSQQKNQVRQQKDQVRQLKHQLCNLNQKSLVYAVLSRGNFCRDFTHFFGVPFTGLKNMVVYQKWQIWGMNTPSTDKGKYPNPRIDLLLCSWVRVVGKIFAESEWTSKV